MKRLAMTVTTILALTMLLGSVAFAWVPPGQRGYEGQPGNQGQQNSN